MKTLSNLGLRLLCSLLFVAGALTALAGFVLHSPDTTKFYVTLFPGLHRSAVRLQPYALPMMIGGTIVGVLALALGLLLQSGSMESRRTVHGSARFAGWWEIWRAGYAAGHRQNRFTLGTHGLQTVALTDWRQREHVLGIAPPGQGKTSGIIIPNLCQERGERGLLANDPKGELYATCAGPLSRHLSVLAFAPLRPDISIHYNPLAHVRTTEDAEDLAAAWIENTGLASQTFWNDTARLLVQAMILHLRAEEPGAPFGRLADLLGSSSFDQVRQILKNSRSKDARALGATFVANASGDPKLVAWIMTGMATRFMVLRNPTVRELMAPDQDPHRNLSFIELINRPQALFLLIPAQHVDRLKPISACLIMQLMNHLTRSQVTRPFAFYLDELCNAGRIPHYERHISLVRAQGMALFQMIQDFGQLRRVYGPNEARTILACSNTKIFFPGVGKEEAEYASELLGETTVKTSSIQRGRAGISERVSYASRRLMTADEVRRLRRRELLVVASNVAPMRLRSRPYFRTRRLRKLITLQPLSVNPHAQATSASRPNGQAAAAQSSSQAAGFRHRAQQVLQIVHRRRPGGPGQVKP